MDHILIFICIVVLIPLIVSEAKLLEAWAMRQGAGKDHSHKDFLQVWLVCDHIYKDRLSWARLIRIYSLLITAMTVISLLTGFL